MAARAQIIPDLAAVEALAAFDGREVTAVGIKVTNAGDGLSDAMRVDPTEFRLGERVIVVLDTIVGRVEHTALDDVADGPVRRDHVLRAEGATIVDLTIVQEHLRVQADRIRRAREAAQGIQRIPGTDEWGDEDVQVPDDPSPLYDDNLDGDDG